MALITCPECGNQTSDKAAFCPHCGYPSPAAPKAEMKPARKPRRYPKLPNGFGSIKKLSGRRTNPYAVYPAVTEFTVDGMPIQPKAIAYAKNWYAAFGILSAYNAGTYKPGQEIVFDDTQITDEFVNNIISAYNYGTSSRKSLQDVSFAELYAQYCAWDFDGQPQDDPDQVRRLKIRRHAMSCAFKNCPQLHEKIFRNLRYADLQAAVDDCPRKHSTKELIVLLFHKLYKYADIADIQKEDYSRHVSIKTRDDDTPGVPFSDDELRTLWAHRGDDTVDTILIMCLTGFRVSAYKSLEVNLEDRYLKGGVKTKNGIGRIVPIHPTIFPMVEQRFLQAGTLFPLSNQLFRKHMSQTLEQLGIPKHTPHDCRDTFATLCDRFGVDKVYLKRLMGHSLAGDLTENKYIHPSLESLRQEVEKIDLLLIVANN